jgi:hypothetical protein
MDCLTLFTAAHAAVLAGAAAMAVPVVPAAGHF